MGLLRFSSCWTSRVELFFFSKRNGWMVCRENQSQKTGFQTLTKNTRRVGNIEENGMMILQLYKNFLCELRRHFHQEIFLLLMNLLLHKLLRNVNNRELLILFISTSKVVFTSNTFISNFFHRHLCKTDTVMI